MLNSHKIYISFQRKMDNCNKVFCVVAIHVLLSLCIQTSLSMKAENSVKKLLIQSSNNETFSFTSLSTFDREQDINETWRATGFQVENLTSILLSEYPLIVSSSLPLKNSSRFFFSKNASASMTILIKSFKHEVLFLNFSYFIGKFKETSDSQAAQLVKTNNTNVNPKPNGATNLVSTTKTEATSNINTSQAQLNTNTVIVITPNMQTLLPELNQTSVSISIMSPSSKDVKSPESVPIKPETQQKRKRRSVILESILNATTPPSSSSIKVEGDLNAIKQTEISMATEKKDVKSNSDGNTAIVSAPPKTSNNVTVTNPIDSLTLVQAVEVIKSAAAAISKGNVISTNSVQQSASVTATRPVDDLSNALTSASIGTTSDGIPKTEKSELITSSTTAPNLKEMHNDISDIKTTTEITRRNHHKSKNGSNKNVKKEKKKRKSKKVDNAAERNEENQDSDDDSYEQSSSSEEEIDERKEEKPKISYKMWRASLEKRNRPPGLYVTVNDDIIFDNWEGIWDKHHVLGKWTGSTKTLDSKKWNHTRLFLNWDSVPTGRDVKITFEWEPVVEHSELILSDIEISTMVSPAHFPCTAPAEWSNDGGYKETDKERFGKIMQTETFEKPVSSVSVQASNESEASIIVLKQSKNGKTEWEVVRVGKAEPSTMGKIKELNLHQLAVSNEKVKLEKKEINSEDILHAILQELRNTGHIPDNTTTKNTSTISDSTDRITQIENETITIPSTTETMTVASSTSETIDVNLSMANVRTTPTTISTSPGETSTNSVTTSSSTTQPPSTVSSTSTTTPSSRTSTTTQVKTSTSSTTTTTPITTAAPNNSREIISEKAPRKTDTETALVVSILTGSIALVILILSIKKRIDISIKSRNAIR